MKKYVALLFLITGIVNLLGAETPGISIENAEDSWFYYTIDPAGLKDKDFSSPEFSYDVLTYFNQSSGKVDFEALGPGQVIFHTDITPGSHILVGFFVPSPRSVYPVKVIQLSVEEKQSDRRYVVYNTASNISLTRGIGLLKDFVPQTTSSGNDGVKIDNRYRDWASIPPAASFTRSFNPVYFTRETRGQGKTLPIESSLFWSHGGTSMKEFKAFMSGGKLSFSFSTHSRMSPGLLFYLYLYKDRSAGTKNKYTIEITLEEGQKGTINLWEEGQSEPTALGSVLYIGYQLEGSMDLSQLPFTLISALSTTLSFDLTSCYYDSTKGEYEEFFFTTIYFKDLDS